jgi:eukaryotic translation initiation factor 2C
MAKQRINAKTNGKEKEKLKEKSKEKETQPEIKDQNDQNAPVPILTREEYGYGKKGTPIKVKVNSFEVTEISEYDKFLKYNIEINPVDKDIEADVKRERSDYGKSIRRRVLKELGLEMEDWFQGVVYVYDGGSTLYTTGYLGFDKVEDVKPVVKTEISLVDFKNLDGEPTRYVVIINRLDTVIELTQLKKYISGEEFDWEFFSDEAFNVLNSLIHKVGEENEKYIQSGKSSIYDKGNKKKISGGVELWLGWFSTVRPGTGSLFVNVNPTFTTFYQPLNLDEFLFQYFPKYYREGLPSEFKNYELKKINEIIKGVLVRPQHPEPVQTERRIKKLLTANEVNYFKYKPRANSDETFPLKKYFKEKYDNQESSGLFVQIMTNDDTSIAWPVEFCKIIEGQRYSNKRLTGRQRGEIILAAKLKPSVNEKETIKGAREVLQLQNDPTGVGMKVEPNLTEADARLLNPTDVKYAGKIMKPKNGQWNLRDVKFVESGERLEFWHVIIFEQSRWMPKEHATEFIENLAQQCKLQGMNIAKDLPDIQYLQYRGPDSVKQAHEEAKKRFKNLPQMIIFIIPGEKSPINTELYETIKRVMDTEIGCLSQCISVDSKRNFRNQQFCANLAMKMNLKLGGVNSILPEDKLRLPNGEEVLFLGADVTHPTNKSGSSICAVVGSLDNEAARFITKYQAQERSGMEEILKIDEMIKEILKEYCDYQRKKRNAKKDETISLPPCIIMYRDGVSESQFERVLRWELPKIKEACTRFRQGYEPKIIFAVVGKRHRTRIFPINPQNKKEADKNGNCLVGTIMDKKVTHPTLNDFYLLSHYANQGTARPSHYTILYDDIKLTIDEFQGLSNALCYNFQRTTSSVSIPAPTYYAHLTCSRAKMYLTTSKGTTRLLKVNEKLKNYPMYFM